MSENSDEIDLIEISKTIWNGRKNIIKIFSLFVLLGVIISLISPVVYTSSTTFIPSYQDNPANSSLSGVASLVGINLGAISSGKQISPSIYPQIRESVEFKRLLLEGFIDEKKRLK